MPRETENTTAQDILKDTLGDDFTNAMTGGEAELDEDALDVEDDAPPDREAADDGLVDKAAGKEKPALKTGKLGEGGTPKPGVTHTDAQARPFAPQAEVKPDAKGNLVDNNGKIVAKAGPEARFYQDAYKAKQHAAMIEQRATRAIEDITSRLNQAIEIGTRAAERAKTLQDAGNVATKLGLSEQQHVEAVQFYKEGLDNPVQFLKKLLTRAAASGIDMTQLGLAPGSVDPKSLMDQIKGLITEQMNPLKERSAQDAAQVAAKAKQDQEAATATANVKTFFDTNPDALPYLPVFTRIYQDARFANWDIERVWDRIQLNLLKGGADPAQQRDGDGQGGPAHKRMPSGRRSSPSGSSDEDAMAPVEQSYADILKGVMTDHGVQ